MIGVYSYDFGAKKSIANVVLSQHVREMDCGNAHTALDCYIVSWEGVQRPTTNVHIGRFQGKFGAHGRCWSFFK